MKSNRRLNAAHQRGIQDARLGLPSNTFHPDKFELWAYVAGWQKGRKDWERNAAHIAKFNQEAE